MKNENASESVSKFEVRRHGVGWIVTRASDGFKTYFENEKDVLRYVNSRGA